MLKQPTDAAIKREADRLLTLPANPGNSVELARALKRHGRSEYHIRGIVQLLLDNQQFYPTPSAVKDAADVVPTEPPPKYKPVDPDCPLCGGAGVVIVRRHITTGPYPGWYEGVGDCECRMVQA